MSTGESYDSLQFAFRISASYISKIVKITLRVLKEKLSPIFLPSIKCDELKGKAEEFGQKWHFPNCVGAVDVFCPKRSGSLYYNYKNFFPLSY
ncbi:unnamed protein product [Macrosiphum euphorbiae]|uniref:Transposase n=1 Tax=Macrosiphum euphorbiae TaxID=13131 RepID=A0AAV0YBN8_9HEMI|nr:unnamed protein product [Macrosiphum euphorbiae]